MNLDELAAALGMGRALTRRLAREDALPPPIKVIRLVRRMVVSRSAVEYLLAATDGSK
ncbi:MAG: hypothetical protein ABIQ47_17535 [Tepidiformaceae bacterium]